MKEIIQGSLDGSGLHLGIASAQWNEAITGRLLDGAERRCDDLGVTEVTVLHVPGALELPLAARRLAEHGCDAVVAIGAVVKGETDHYDVVVRESSSGISRVALDTGIPVANAVLAVHEIAHAVDRAQEGDANKGAEAVDAAVLAATALAELGRRP